MEVKGLKINFLGDSITQGSGTTAPEKRFVDIMKKECKLKEARNYGIGGTRYALQKKIPGLTPAEIDSLSFCERFSQMDDDADVVVVFGGTNDYGHGNAPIGGFSDRTPETFYGACHYLYSGLIEKYIGKTIVILTPLHRDNELRNTGDAKVNGVATLKEYVDIIREVAEYYSLPVLDLFKTSGLQPEVLAVKEKYMPDGLHPSDEGNRILADKLQAFLKNL